MFYKSRLSALLLWALTKQTETIFIAINIENSGGNVSGTPEGLSVSWRNPNPRMGSHCYESIVRFKTTCDTSWTSTAVKKFSYELRTSRQKEYQFQIRMKYDKRCEPSGLNEWTSWTRTLSLGNATDTGSCRREEPFPQPVLTLLPLLLCFLLLCSLTQERVRRYFLPVVPDPKHRLDELFKMEMSQYRTDPEMECDCETVVIEIVNSEGKASDTKEEKLLEKDKETTGEEEQGKGGRDPWTQSSLTKADLQGYFVYNGGTL